MKSYLILLMTMLSSPLLVIAQDMDVKLLRDSLGFFYSDSLGKPLGKKRYFYAGRFYEGLAAAAHNGYVGYINKSEEFVIEPKYEYALPFIDGIAKVWLDGKITLIDIKGNELPKIDEKYTEDRYDFHKYYDSQNKRTLPIFNYFLDNIDSVYFTNINYGGYPGYYCENGKDNESYNPKIISKRFSNINELKLILEEKPDVLLCVGSVPLKRYIHNLYFINPLKADLSVNESARFMLQAKDKNGKWRYIESRYRTDVVYENLQIKGKRQYNHRVHSYQGGFNTKLRVVYSASLYTAAGYKDIELISNEINGSINASQFVRNKFDKSSNDIYPFEDFEFEFPIVIPCCREMPPPRPRVRKVVEDKD